MQRQLFQIAAVRRVQRHADLTCWVRPPEVYRVVCQYWDISF